MAGSHRLSGAAVGLALPTALAALTAPATRAQTALTNPGVLFAAAQTESLRSADAQVQSTRRDVRDVSVNAVTGAIERSRTRLRDQIPNYTITRQFAVGGARVSRAADDVETETDQFVSIKTGGLQVGGVRFLF
jgi:hypothetical protein